MTRLARRAVVVAASLTLTLPWAAMRPAAALSCDAWDTICQQLQQAQQQQQDVQNQIQQIQQGIQDTQAKASATIQIIKTLNVQIAAQRKLIAATQKQLDVIERQVRYITADLDRREAEVKVRQQLLNQRVRALDQHGALDYFQLVVTSSNFSQLVDRITAMHDVVRSDQTLVDSLKTERDQVRVLHAQLQTQRDEQARLLQQQQDEKAQLDQQLASQQAALVFLQQLEVQYKQQAQLLAQANAQIAAQIVVLQQQYAAELATLGGSGHYSWPEQGWITQAFGCTDLLGEPYDPNCPSRHFHQGLDIAADWGTPVGAGDAGVVVNVVTGCSEGVWWCGGGYGNQVWLLNGNGWGSLYAHLSSVTVSVGQRVARHQPVGYEGSTGYSTGPHLHFGILYNGSWVDPLNYL